MEPHCDLVMRSNRGGTTVGFHSDQLRADGSDSRHWRIRRNAAIDHECSLLVAFDCLCSPKVVRAVCWAENYLFQFYQLAQCPSGGEGGIFLHFPKNHYISMCYPGYFNSFCNASL